MPLPNPIRSREEFIERYRYLCRHIARKFVVKAFYLRSSGGRKTREGEFDYFQETWSETDLEDLTQAAILRLCRLPDRYWNEKYQIPRIIVNAIIDEWKAKHKVSDHECQMSAENFFDSLPGRNGLLHGIEYRFDSARVKETLPSLTSAQRLVIEFYFGLNGLCAIKERAIAAKLGRTEMWVKQRLESGLGRIRSELGISG